MPKRRRQGPNTAWQTSRVDPTLEEWEISKSELLNECKNSEGSETIATCLEQIYLYRFWQILDGFSNLPTVEQNCILSADEVSALKHFTNNEAFSKKYRVYINDMQFNGFKVHLIETFLFTDKTTTKYALSINIFGVFFVLLLFFFFK